MKKQRFYMISLDAFGSKDLAYAKTLPHFKYLLDRSAQVKEVKSVYPSLTYMAHTSIVTGVSPKTHGIVNNTFLQPKRLSPDWHWYAKDIQVPTLFDLAKAAGYRTASFLWPVTGRSKSIDYNFVEIFPNRKWQSQVGVSLYASSASFIYQLNRKFGHLRNGIAQPELDDFLTASIVETIKTKNPDFLAIHFVDLDSMRHQYGVDTPETQAAIRRMDERLGEILQVMAYKDILKDTVIAVLGDHYQIDLHTAIRLNKDFQQRGWIKCNRQGELKHWDVIAKSADGACYIYTKPGMNLNHVRQCLEQYNEEFEMIYSKREATALGADPECSFLIEGYAGYFFLDEINGPILEKVDASNSLYKGTHGYSPEKPDYATTLFISGPGIDSTARIPNGRLIDEAPTFASIMGLSFPNEIEGIVLEDVLEKDIAEDDEKEL